ncbi:MAG TPA: DUF362 domain-containing protein [Acidimicrobiia bacterium]|nr:DUF362 domain-containing protein [Acidimicrobiia bacterium]
MTQLETALLDDVGARLDRWRAEYGARPDLERERLWLLALEREQIVAVAYREEAVADRVGALDLCEELRSLVRQTLVWIWKDEALHAEYLRGMLLRRGGTASSLVVYGRQLEGAVSGWVSATEHHTRARSAPIRTGAADVFVAAAGVLGLVPPVLRQELRYQSFHRYCELNVALEATAELAYRRLIELAADDDEHDTLARIRADEERHGAAFRILAGLLTVDDGASGSTSTAAVLDALAAISPWFVPAALRVRSSQGTRARSFGTGARVAVRSGQRDADKVSVLDACLDAAGLSAIASGARSAAIRVSFMLGYDRRDCSNVNDPALVEALARYLERQGVADVAVLEAPTVYGNSFAHRSVAEVASYFGFDSPHYRIVDIGADLRPFVFERGFVQRAITGTWVDADLRIVMPKLRTDPTEFAHLCLSTLEGSTGAIDATFYAKRLVDFRSATMMLLDVAPPDFAIVDAWAPVAGGPFGVMGCRRPADIRHVYAGADALAVDEVVLADLGVADPHRAPIVRRAHHWFGIGPLTVPVDGTRPALETELRGAHASPVLRALGTMSYPVYVYLSRDGDLFVPAMDAAAFPPTGRRGPVTRAIRWAAQRAFGLRPPAGP